MIKTNTTSAAAIEIRRCQTPSQVFQVPPERARSTVEGRRKSVHFFDIFRPGWKRTDSQARATAALKLDDPAILIRLATQDPSPEVRAAAVSRLTEAARLQAIATGDPDAQVRCVAVWGLDDADALHVISRGDAVAEVRQAAEERLQRRQLVIYRESKPGLPRTFLASLAEQALTSGKLHYKQAAARRKPAAFLGMVRELVAGFDDDCQSVVFGVAFRDAGSYRNALFSQWVSASLFGFMKAGLGEHFWDLTYQNETTRTGFEADFRLHRGIALGLAGDEIQDRVAELVAIYRRNPDGFGEKRGTPDEARIQEIGRALHQHGGMASMRSAHREFALRCGAIPGAARNLEFMWEGIGEWSP